ncbi:hypothetical protein ACJRO7_033024 [Eucalyptus globulus]|uniref:Uncharacterized protein n=1 Tax=Eucalyptus globulus TaxID=34317 RepID=A0ABD3JY23_EUCGL
MRCSPTAAGKAARRSRPSRIQRQGVAESRNGEVSEVLKYSLNLGDQPIGGEPPGVDPRDGAGRAEALERPLRGPKEVTDSGTNRKLSSDVAEEAHQELGGEMEPPPPLKDGSEDAAARRVASQSQN